MDLEIASICNKVSKFCYALITVDYFIKCTEITVLLSGLLVLNYVNTI